MMVPGLFRVIAVAASTCPFRPITNVVVGSDSSPNVAIDTAPIFEATCPSIVMFASAPIMTLWRADTLPIWRGTAASPLSVGAKMSSVSPASAFSVPVVPTCTWKGAAAEPIDPCA